MFFYVYEALKKFAAERQIKITNGVSLCSPVGDACFTDGGLFG